MPDCFTNYSVKIPPLNSPIPERAVFPSFVNATLKRDRRMLDLSVTRPRHLKVPMSLRQEKVFRILPLQACYVAAI